MDPIAEESFPSPAHVVEDPPTALSAASLPGPKIFVLSPFPGNRYEVDRYFYSPAAVTEGDYAALFTFAAHYGRPLAIYNCPNIVTFQASHPSTIVRPFSEVPPPILQRGHELQSSPEASSAPRNDGSASPSLLSHVSAQGSSRGHDPPLVAAATRASSSRNCLFLTHPIARILTESRALLPSMGEWGACMV